MKAVLCRSAALYIFLYQFHLLAAGLSEAGLFTAALLGAFASGAALHLVYRRGCGGRRGSDIAAEDAPLDCFGTTRLAMTALPGGWLSALATILLVPQAVRLFIALPRAFAGGMDGMIALDSLLLNYDRAAFVTTAPFYWTAFTTFLSLGSRRALRFSAAADCLLLAAAFSMTGSAALYTLPVVRIGVFAAIVFFELASLALSPPPELKPQKKDYAAALAALFLLTAAVGALLVRPLQDAALEQGGGLLQPKLFSFDFAPYLKLEDEISMNDDLVFIVRKNSRYDGGEADEALRLPEVADVSEIADIPEMADDHYLMRRFVLSDYNAKEQKDRAIGFFRGEPFDEDAHPAKLPAGRREYQVAADASRRRLRQEYYLVNIDGAAFIAMNEIAETLPFESWDASSFKSAYAVDSMVSVSAPAELIDAVPDGFGARALGLTGEAYRYYTKFFESEGRKTGRETRIAALAEEITGGAGDYWGKIQSVYQYLKFGDYRYSLKPGAAPDGDQLAYFLFDGKKGYCSYFAFAFASLLRSIGVPCRVAVGFFLNPDEGRLDFYPVRSNMAHAWVEVWFPGFGWIEYDPTTENLAADEEFQFGSGTPAELFERLMKEIIDNHGRLKIKEAEEEGGTASAAARAGKLVKKSFAYLALAVIAAFVIAMRFGLYIRCRLERDPRRKTLLLWRHIKRRLRLAGARKSAGESESGWIDRLCADTDGGVAGVPPAEGGSGIPAAGGDEAWGETSPLKTDRICNRTGAASPLRELYDNVSAAKFAARYTADEQKAFFGLYKAFDGWYKKRFGLLKLLESLKPSKKRGSAKLLAVVFCMLLASSNEQAQEAGEAADALFSQAFTAENNEFWERAIELYMRGKAEYPLDYRFPLRLGGLYFDRELYRLAMDEFLAANRLLPGNTELLYRLAQTAGSLNENRAAAAFLESLLAIEPDNREAIGSLGWMYFKLHRLRDGEALLADAIERLGAEPDFCMTLATIYSDMFDYDGSKARYLEAVNGALGIGAVDFAAVSYYNLSILESRFYRYEDAFAATTSSLMLSNRASGHLARGELTLRRLDMDEAFAEYNKSYELDKSQLSKLSLAQAFLIAGDLEEARLYAETSLAQNNLYWMLNYGIDPAGYRRDLHEILYKTYAGLAASESLTARYGLPDVARGLARRIEYRFKSRVHRLLYQKYALLSAGAFETDGGGLPAVQTAQAGDSERHLDALAEYFNAFYDYRGRAIDYLRAAEDFELALIPEAAGYYLFEAGKLLKDEALLNEALAALDPVWEKDLAADACTEVALLAKNKRQNAVARDAAGRLFALNPGALRQNGLRLPVNVEMDAAGGLAPRRAKTLLATLNRAGFDTNPAGGQNAAGSRWTLRLRFDGGETEAELYDGGTGITKRLKAPPLQSFSAKHRAAFANALAREVF